MSTQPPEQNPHDYDEVTRLRLQLHHAEAQRDAFKKAFNTEVLKVMRASVIQATISADNEVARLASEVDGLSAQLVELDDLKAEADQLKADIKLEKENEDRLVREMQRANNEVYGLKAQVAALIDDQARLKAEVEEARKVSGEGMSVTLDLNNQLCAENARLKAEVERLKNNNDYLDQKLDEEIARAASFAGEIARLRKLGVEMGKHLPDTDEANRAYIDFEAGGRS
jgi:chromosome segregation ATPase